MSSPAQVIRQFLLGQAILTESDTWPAYVMHLPNTPDEVACLYDTSGVFDGRIMETGEKIVHPGVMILVRGKEYADVYDKVHEITDALDAILRNEVVLSTDYAYLLQSVSRTSPPMALGVEETGDRRRHRITINMTVTLRES